MDIEQIRKKLYELQDTDYRDFQSKLIPGVETDSFIGVRTPELKKLAKELAKDGGEKLFLRELPHRYFDENQLHAFLISAIKDYERCMDETNRFLPYVDNWATCDQMSPAVFKKQKEKLLSQIKIWIASDQTYTIRFGIGMLLRHFLDVDFDPAYPEWVAGIRSDEYYVNMMIAWYFATALAKQYDTILPFITEHRLDAWIHNKTIQKAVESYRISPEQKEYLRSRRRKI